MQDPLFNSIPKNKNSGEQEKESIIRVRIG